MAIRVLERRRFVRMSSVGTLPAPLVRVNAGTPVACKSIDVSRMGLGILSSVELGVDEELTMSLSGESLTLKVVAKIQETHTLQWRYSLLAQNPNENLENRFRIAGLIVSKERPANRGAAIESKKINRRPTDDRAPRFGIDWKLQLDANILGNRTTICLYVANISRSGMLVTTFENKLKSIEVNTILDITLDPEKECLSRPVHGFAKVVRVFTEVSPETSQKLVSLGIVISEIFPEDKTIWDLFMRSLEGATKPDVQGKPAA